MYSSVFSASRIPCFKAILSDKVRSSHALALFLLPLAHSRWRSGRHWWCSWCIPFFLSCIVADCSRRCCAARDAFPSSSHALAFCYGGGLWLLVKVYPRLGFWQRKTPLRWPILVSPTTIATCSMKTLPLKR